MHRLGLVSISFRKHAPREILQAMREVGLTEIEWGSDVHAPPEKAAEIARLQAEFGINCSSYGTYFTLGKTPLSELERYIAAAQLHQRTQRSLIYNKKRVSSAEARAFGLQNTEQSVTI